MTQGVLGGVRVLEVAMYAFGPAAGAVLADWGADVIKVEHPETGDPLRGLAAYGVAPGEGGVSYLWEVLNRGKRSVGIDIAHPDGRELLLSLCEQADVFVTNFLAPARKRLMIDVDDVLARNPRIIYARGTGHGPKGPDADKGGYDGVSFWARSGVSIAAMPPDARYPIGLPGPAYGDIQSGVHMAGGIAAALFQRERTGKGAVVDVSLLGSGLWAMQPAIAGAHASGQERLAPLDRSRPPNPLWNVYRTGDHKFVTLSMLDADRYWPGFCAAVGRSDLVEDERFADNNARSANIAECVALVDQIFAQHTLAECARMLDAQDGPWSITQTPGAVLADAQAVANDYLQWVRYENGATLPLIHAPAQIDEQSATLRAAPAHAADTDGVLTAAGLSWEEIVGLKVAGAIA
ncbi:CoA transferase [Mycobacterium sp.]|uniref:CaiB/BaiF CoA transferase family protein n=1 Tax=Mycobacterium sp. TaxID=1785 RepID=UPI002B8338A8|nr:CoA transferase [Mycobacterium sp.]HKP44066.1 CoA transferase [Mycobacterium sp.]